MSFLLDTNVVSEWTKPRPDPGVIAWLAETDEDRIFISVITLAELGYGIERLTAGRRKQQLEEWLHDVLPTRFEGRILSVDINIGKAWGILVARSDAKGRSISAMDGLIAATAETHGLTLVTRNVSDFETTLAGIFNPWAER